jgi:hypothetical protein
MLDRIQVATVLCGTLFPAFAQNPQTAAALIQVQRATGAVSIKLIDQTGEELAEGLVVLGAPGRRPIEGAPNSKGLVVFRDVAPGDYKLRVWVKGFKSFARDVRIVPGNNVPLTAMMTIPDSGFDTDSLRSPLPSKLPIK